MISDDTDGYIHGGAICRNLTASALTFIAENCNRPSITGVVSVGEGVWSAKPFTDETDLSACAVVSSGGRVVVEVCRPLTETITYR